MNQKLTSEQFKSLKPAQKKEYILKILAAFHENYNRLYDNNEPYKGAWAFTWISLHTKNCPITNALARHLNATTNKIFKNYRGSKTAWYHGSQNDLRVIRALESATVAIALDFGVTCSFETELD